MANHGSATKSSMEEVRTDIGKLGEKKSRVIRTGHGSKIKATLTRANWCWFLQHGARGVVLNDSASGPCKKQTLESVIPPFISPQRHFKCPNKEVRPEQPTPKLLTSITTTNEFIPPIRKFGEVILSYGEWIWGEQNENGEAHEDTNSVIR